MSLTEPGDGTGRLRAILTDRLADDEPRLAALHNLPESAADATVRDVLALLQDETNGGESLRAACVEYLHRQGEFGPASGLRGEIIAGLLPRLRSPQEGVRKRAMAFLSGADHSVAVGLLADVLDGKETLFTREEVIHFLAAGGLASHRAVLAGRRNDLLRQRRDPGFPDEVRLEVLEEGVIAPTGAFLDAVVELLGESRASARVRAGCIRQLGKVANQRRFPDAAAAMRIGEAVRALVRDPSPAVSAAAKEYVEAFGRAS
jgi:hypothetical protein